MLTFPQFVNTIVLFKLWRAARPRGQPFLVPPEFFQNPPITFRPMGVYTHVLSFPSFGTVVLELERKAEGPEAIGPPPRKGRFFEGTGLVFLGTHLPAE